MRYVLAALAVVSVTSLAVASSLPRGANASEILAATKQLASKDCRPHYFGGGLYVSRCEYEPAGFIGGKWGVIVHRILVDSKGNFVGAMGTDTVYEFNKAGKFVDTIPGM